MGEKRKRIAELRRSVFTCVANESIKSVSIAYQLAMSMTLNRSLVFVSLLPWQLNCDKAERIDVASALTHFNQ